MVRALPRFRHVIKERLGLILLRQRSEFKKGDESALESCTLNALLQRFSTAMRGAPKVAPAP